MERVRNIFTEVEYEAIQYEEYTQEQVKKCREFITEKLNVWVRIIMPKMFVCNLEHIGYETVINPSDYILRRMSDNTVFRVISNDIFKSNFEIVTI